MAEIWVTSFGYGHGAPPPAHITIDVRDHYRDPHVSPDLRNLTAADERVTSAVLGTPGVPRLFGSVLDLMAAYLSASTQVKPLTVAIGCVGGRHRSAVIAEAVARYWTAGGHNVSLTHRDINRAVITRPTA